MNEYSPEAQSLFDPVELEIIRNALVAAAEEMSVTVWRTSRSSVVREILDYSTCVFDADGLSIAQSARIPVHLNSMATCLRDVIRDHLPLESWEPGDVVLTNDPYCGGQHLPDLQAFMPVFSGEQRIAVVGVLVHHLDVGGGAPGSYYAQATEVFQEGIRIPPVKVVRRGERNDDLIRTILQNSREPENVGGDFESQLAALKVGALRLEDVASRYGHNTLRAATSAIQQQSEIAMRHAIDNVPDGDYAFEDFVDDDGIHDARIRVHAQLRIHGDSLTVDLSGCDGQVAGPVNCTMNMSEAAVVCALLMGLGRDIPANAGCYRPIAVVAPPGTVVNALAPAPVANRMAVGHRVVTTVLGALADALPGQIPAAYYGVSYAYALSAERIDSDGHVERGVYFDLECGGWGAHADADGANGLSCGFHNVANSPVEMIESDYPVLFHCYGLRVDSGGSGATRGGLGLVRDFELTGDAGRFSANLDRFKVAPYGLEGGSPGATGKLEVKHGEDDWRALGSKVSGLTLERGDRIRLQTSGGGGYGDPNSRSESRRAEDRRQGYVS